MTVFWADIILIVFLVFALLLLATAIVHLFSGVPYVPTPKKVVDKMVEIAELKKGEVVFDLGCGDGRFLFAAEKVTETGGVGYELAPLPYLVARIGRWLNGAKTELHLKSLFRADLSRANVLMCYLMPHMLKKLSKKILTECQEGTRIVSHGFKIEGLKPVKVYERNNDLGLPTIYYYEV